MVYIDDPSADFKQYISESSEDIIMIFDWFEAMKILDSIVISVLHKNDDDKTPYHSPLKKWMIIFELLKVPIRNNE